MKQHIALITLVVPDYDEAIAFYTSILGFQLLEDTVLTPEKRWVRVAPPGSTECALLLAKAANDEQRSRIGNQTGGRVGFFLYTDDFSRDFHRLTVNGVRIIRPPADEPFGKVAVFADPYGNYWDLIEPSHKS